MSTRNTTVAALIALACAAGPARAEFTMGWYTIDCGGSVATGTGSGGVVFTMTSAIGQSDAGPQAGPMTGGTFAVGGGYLPVSQTPPPACPQDLNADGTVNTVDLSILLQHFGQSVASVPAAQAADINSDGTVNTVDLSLLLQKFGRACP